MTAQAELVTAAELAPKPAKAPGVPTGQVLDALIAHYRKPGAPRDGEILITEAETPAGGRRCDLIRVGMWRSRGTGIDGHEIKVSRSDWLRELDDPAKAEAWWPYVSRWWVVAPPGIVADGELPDGWGLMELPARGRRFKVRAPAATKEPRLTVGLMVELMRRADNARLAELDQLRQRHRGDLLKQRDQARAEHAEQSLPFDTKRRLELLDKVEKALGMRLDAYGDWNADRITRIGAEELAKFLQDAAAHVSAQRRAAEVERLRRELLGEARRTVMALERDQ